MGIRQPVVAGRFYPGDSSSLKRTVNDLLSQFSPQKNKNVLGVVSPHAGYIYSGGVCAETLKSSEIPDTVVILGPNHQGRGAQVALATQDWATPLGIVSREKTLSDMLLHHSNLVEQDDTAHEFEHSLEVQVPFLQELTNNVKIVALCISRLSFSDCSKLGKDLAAAVREFDKPVMIVASSDMSHYESRTAASKKDHMALEHVVNLNPKQLYDTVFSQNISMCGVIPTTVMLYSTLQLGANTAELVRYTDSGEASGDTDQVVGYAGALVCRT